jgi:hypothetical protein
MAHNRAMARLGPVLAAAIALVSAAPASADEEACDFCLTPDRATERPLAIEIHSGLQFSRMALRGQVDGAAEIDPQTGAKRVDANMIDLGGLSFQGHATITGEPLRPVRIDMPHSVSLRSPDGAEAELSDFVTNLPPVAMLDENGMLEFSFGARLSSQGARGGNFRGRINIRVDYF